MSIRDERSNPIFIHSVLDDAGLDPYEFRLYGRYARRAGNSGSCYESQKSLAQDLQMSVPRLRDAKQTLEEKGLIRVEKREGTTDLVTLTAQSEWGTSPKSSVGGSPKSSVPPPQKNGEANTRYSNEGSPSEGSACVREEDHPAVKVFVEEVGRRPHGQEKMEIPEVVGDGLDVLEVFRKECKKARRNAGGAEAVKWGYLADDFEEAMDEAESDYQVDKSWT